mmetsp:Transcript_1758/g.7307  ORF Transcript_1758/g.7307 Transcript_1758/m.7307 type:complete len:450 (+) Transcript_1758:198-1547(+)
MLGASLVGRAPTIARLRGADTAGVRSKHAIAIVHRRSGARRSVVVTARRSDFTVPERMLSLDDVQNPRASPASSEAAANNIVAKPAVPNAGIVQYTLTFKTGEKRGAGLSSRDGGVTVMLIAEDGRGFVQRVDRYPQMAVPCDDVNPETDCEPIGIYSAPRFERGAEDTVTFDAPDLGLPAAMWISPEDGGMWYVDEVELRCSDGSEMAIAAEEQRRGAIVSYPCDDWVGGTNPDDAALELRPNGFFKMTPEQRTKMREDGLREYGELKFKMLTATGVAVALGCLATASLSGDGAEHGADHLELMRSFASGGGVGLVYLYMLTRSVDTIGPGDSAKPFGLMLLDAMMGIASSGPVRLLMLALMGTWGARYVEATTGVGGHPHYGDFFAAVIGFFSYKAGVLVAGFSGVDFTAMDADVVVEPVPVRVAEQPRRVPGTAVDEQFKGRPGAR